MTGSSPPLNSSEDFSDETEYNLARDVDFQTVEKTPEVGTIDGRRSLFSRPLFKLGLGVGAAAFILGFVAMISMLGGSNTDPVAESDSEDPEALTLTLDDEAGGFIASGKVDEQQIQAERALAAQQLELAQVNRDDAYLANQAARPTGTATTAPPPAAPTPAAATTRVPPSTVPPSTVSRPQSVNPAATPAVRPTVRPTVPPPLSTRTQPVTPVRPAVPPAPPSVTSIPEVERVDPQELWLQASTTGTYGMMPVEPSQSEPQTESTEVPAPPAAPRPVAVAVSDYQLKGYTEAVAVPEVTAVPGLRDTAIERTILMGQQVTARVTTAIAWLNPEAQYLIELDAPLVYRDGTEAIPVGSQLVVQPVSVNESNGYAELAVVGYLDIDSQSHPLSAGMITINGPGGDPLIAQRYGDLGGEIASNDIELFLIGALGEVGSVLNRPESQTSTNSIFGSSTSTQNGDANIFGAVLEGGATAIADRMGDRNDERLDDLLAREVIYFLGAGTEVEIYVNQEFELLL